MYDVIVVGAGHAGVEAALVTSNMKLNTLLITGNLDMAASLPCNPSIGGPAKGIVVREVDALGGFMGKAADMCQIQTKMLNSSKGPAVRALRLQIDKKLYPQIILNKLKETNHLTLKEAFVESLIIKNNQVYGVKLEDGSIIESKVVIITIGTYLNSKIFQGSNTFVAAPDDQKTTFGISNQLRSLGFEIQRLKTGTPARVKSSSIDFTQVNLEPGSDKVYKFSFDKGYDSILKVNVACHLTYTNLKLHNLLNNNLEKSAMYSGNIEGVGPRYCPSIEDKLTRFKDKERHQIFFEPESMSLDSTYIQGLSTSMPIDIQDKMLRLIPGLKDCVVEKYAYAIEYDALNPLDLWPTLETKIVKNLFSAGQMNGTSGYEEAAGQGIIAGINAASLIKRIKPLILKREEAYLGVLIDDLVTKGTKEPYRLLTSRAEYRLLLRHDNADLRLREYGYKYGLISKEQYDYLIFKKGEIKRVINLLKETKVIMTKATNDYLKTINSSSLTESVSAFDLIKRPEVKYTNIKDLTNLDTIDEVFEQVEIEIKYEGYIKKAINQAKKLEQANEKIIPNEVNYKEVKNLALEAIDKLQKVRPKTLGQAMRISGVNPSDISILSIYLETLKK